MRKKIAAAAVLAACTLLTACGGSDTKTGNEPLAHAVYTSDSVSLASYTGLKAEKKNYQITEEDVEQAVREQLAEFAEYESVKRASEDGDWVYADFTASIDGSAVRQEDNYYFILGEQEFGSEFDEKLTGVSAGDSLDFTIDYDSDFSDSEFAGKEVQFEVKVTDVQMEVLPDTTDEFIKENTKYSSYDEFYNAMHKSVEETYETESMDELKENLIQQVVDASSILQYTKDEYNAAKEMVQNQYLGYADVLGTDLDSLYEELEISDEDIEEEIQDELYRTIVINAIIENEKFSLSDQDYEDSVAYYMKQNDYSSKEEFLEDYGEEEVRRQALEDKVLDYLAGHAEITEVEAEHEDE